MTFKETIKSWMTVPVTVVSTAVAVGAIFAFLGINVSTPAEQLSTHIQQEQLYHKVESEKTDSMNVHLKNVETYLESALIGECLENPRADLVRQKLINKCKELGVNR